MYVSMKDILRHAHKNSYAVMAVNSINMEMARAVVEAAEEEKSPIILQFGMNQMSKHAHPTEMVPMIKALADKASVPVCLNLDHGQDFDFIVKCIHMNFSNVMFDGSSLPYEENVRRTSIISNLAHPMGISVEAELGHVGQAADNEDENEDLLTNAEQAKEFVERTGVDALAVAIGTAHGAYPKGKIPKLDFERLKELKKRLDMPLVLHGGSGAGEENIRKAVAYGINKINVCTDAFQVAKDAMLKATEQDKNIDYMNMCMVAEREVKEFVKNYIRVIGSNNQYIFKKTEMLGFE
ncbi:class II fructose-bisphosphate aldolase [Anaerotalea alkaliphila]|uniref:Class II fructose-bisphosphate aldolase n=1 Tax=Anaerotalea alkaliphila TaxID=2662126 RepID=A0A7X5HWA8_9FIRM|nr:class II fructose-bisphosphate aldolase [Anaerotalea alkaliphila]NDL67852.1 class II fructose-bisphosphate aldolase [Anaerotalea alkaliphila]